MNSHECIIGLYFDYENTELMTYNELKHRTEVENKFYEEHSHYDYFGKPYKLEDYFDRRKSTNFTLFDYCPYCGEKINWKELKERNKNEN